MSIEDRLRRLVGGHDPRAGWSEAYFGTTPEIDVAEPALKAGRRIRDASRPPAVMIYGVMPCSGTVMVGEMLRLHPLLGAYPNELWEIPFLAQIGDLEAFRDAFFGDYRQNRQRMGEHDLLALFGAAFIGYLHSFLPAGQRLLLKEAGIKNLHYVPIVFPAEHLLLLIRDGRDLVHATLETWPEMDFELACEEWARSSNALLTFADQHRRRAGLMVARYEDALDSPVEFVERACATFDLDRDQFPFSQLDEARAASVQPAGSAGDLAGSAAGLDVVSPLWSAWSEDRKATFKRLAGDALVRAGYAEDQDW